MLRDLTRELEAAVQNTRSVRVSLEEIELRLASLQRKLVLQQLADEFSAQAEARYQPPGEQIDSEVARVASGQSQRARATHTKIEQLRLRRGYFQDLLVSCEVNETHAREALEAARRAQSGRAKGGHDDKPF